MSGSRSSPAPGVPALVLLYDLPGVSLKVCPLEREATILGKARGCDLLLHAPDISHVHCVISRSGGVFSVRDCDSRAGIRVNGERVTEATLRDGDLLQVGPFSFRLRLPAAATAPGGADDRRQQRRERQRQNLARLALSYRRKWLELYRLLVGSLPGFSPQQVAGQRSGLRQVLRHLGQRLERLQQAERDLSRDRELLAREQQALRERLRALEAGAANAPAGWREAPPRQQPAASP